MLVGMTAVYSMHNCVGTSECFTQITVNDRELSNNGELSKLSERWTQWTHLTHLTQGRGKWGEERVA